MKRFCSIILLMCFKGAIAQSYQDSVIEHRVKQMGEIIDTASHILQPEEIDHFEGLSFFKVDSLYRISASFKKSIGKRFKMPTTTERMPIYRRYGYVTFTLCGTQQRLTIYQNMALRKKKEFKKYLFLPFRDGTSGNESYGGGRYLDLQIPENDLIQLDFNFAYNPYCAYSHRYSCPIPPEENTLKCPVTAGEKVPSGLKNEH